MSCASCMEASGTERRRQSEGQGASVSLARVVLLASMNQQALASRAPGAMSAAAAAGVAQANPLSAAAVQLAALDANGLTTLLHVTPDGDALLTSSVVADNGGDLVLHGSIGPIPYEVHLHVELKGTRLALTVQVTQPVPLGPFTWYFDLGGVVRGKNGEIVAAASIAPASLAAPPPPAPPLVPAAALAAAAPPPAGHSFNFGCLLKCAGGKILPTLLACLPSLIGGVQAFIACIVAQLGQNAPDIIKCVTEQCL